MPTLNEMFPSQYLNGEDLKGKAYVLKIRFVKTEEIFDQQKRAKAKKWVVYFEDARKGCLIGKTQTAQIFEGTDTKATEEWTGKTIEIYPTNVVAFGETHCVPRFRKASVAQVTPTPAEFQVEAVEDEEETVHTGAIDPDNPLGV